MKMKYHRLALAAIIPAVAFSGRLAAQQPVGEFVLGENTFPEMYSGAYATFTAGETAQYTIRNSPAETSFGTNDFDLIACSTGDPVSDLADPDIRTLDCTWETVDNFCQTTVSLEQDKTYILFRDFTFDEFTCEILLTPPDFSVVPADGSSVSGIDSLTVTFDGGIAFAGESFPIFYQNGREILRLDGQPDAPDACTLVFRLDEPVTQLDTYQIEFPEGCFLLGEKKLKSKKTLITLTIVIPPFVPTVVEPADGSVVDDLSRVVFTFPDTCYKRDENIVTVTNLDTGEEVVKDWLNKTGGCTLEFIPDDSFYEKGTYRVTISENAVGDKAWLYDEGLCRSNPELSYTYTVTGRCSLQPTGYSPDYMDTISSYEERTIELSFDRQVYIAPDAKAYLEKGQLMMRGLEGTLSLRDDGRTVAVTFADSLDENSNYVMHIPSKSISDKPFGCGSEDARFTPRLTNWYRSSYYEPQNDIVLDLISPAGGEADSLLYIELHLSAECLRVDADKIVTLSVWDSGEPVCSADSIVVCNSAPEDKTPVFDKVLIKLERKINAPGEYELFVPGGKICDINYAEGKGGHANAEARFRLVIKGKGMELPVCDNRPVDIFNLQGVLLLEDASPEDIDNLSPGFYIIGKEKIIITE